MKKLTGLFLLFLLFQAHTAQAADWQVSVASNKDVYEIGEEAVFHIELTKNRKPAKDKSLLIKASFPKSGTAVSLIKIAKGRYRFNHSGLNSPQLAAVNDIILA